MFQMRKKESMKQKGSDEQSHTTEKAVLVRVTSQTQFQKCQRDFLERNGRKVFLSIEKQRSELQ